MRISLASVFSIAPFLLGGCVQEAIICNDQQFCCRVQTGQTSYVSQCLPNARACAALADTLPRSGIYPITSYPANKEGVNTIDACITGHRQGSISLDPHSQFYSPMLLAELAPKDLQSLGLVQSDIPQGPLFIAASTPPLLAKGAAQQCKKLCDELSGLCLQVNLTDTPGLPKEQIANGLRALSDSLISNPTTVIKSHSLLANFGMALDPCNRGDTHVTPIGSSSSMLQNGGAKSDTCVLSLAVPAGTPGGDFSVVVPKIVEGVLTRTASPASVNITFEDPQKAMSLNFSNTGFGGKYGGKVLETMSDGKQIYIATEGDRVSPGCFQVPIPTDQLVPPLPPK